MAAVEPGYASWLTSDARYVSSVVAGSVAAWGDLAEDSTVTTALASKADAQAVGNQQAAILAGPNARDKILVAGLHSDKIGLAVTITGDRAGYETGATVIVIGAQESETVKTTVLTVIKRL